MYSIIVSDLILDRYGHTKADQEHSKSTPPNIKALDFSYTKWHESIVIIRDHFITDNHQMANKHLWKRSFNSQKAQTMENFLSKLN